MTDNTREYDVIIFGASGYTGEYVVEELANSAKNKNIKWAVAGRNVEKVSKSMQNVQGYLKDIDILHIPVLKADVGDPDSILKMCKSTKLVINCVGPYMLYGEVVVSACVEAGTHHVDISGEFTYLESMQAKYFDAARKKGVYIIQACGFDSIPGDYGISLVKKNFPGDLNSVEYYIQIDQGPSGRTTNSGTFMSGVYSVKDHLLHSSKYTRQLKENVFFKDIPRSKYILKKRSPPLFRSDVVNGLCLWFLGPDVRIIKRSQMFRFEYMNERPVEFNAYVNVSLKGVLLGMLIGMIVFPLSLCSYGRSLLEKYPSFFTLGQFSKGGPTRQQVEEGTTTFTFIGEGWKDKLSQPTDQHESKPDTKLKLTISGPEPAYPLTAMCMVQAGLTILQESDIMPLEGGVLTPGVAFENTGLSKRLEDRGMKISFESI